MTGADALADASHISHIPMLERAACASIIAAIDAQRAHWLQRDAALPFYTLGATSYLDALNDPQLYRQRAALYNPLLQAAFAALYQQLLSALAAQLGADCVLAPETAHPGFHIFEFHPAFREPAAVIHFDRQFEDIPWQRPQELDFEQPLSFTLPLQLPASGGGLNTWPADWRHCHNSPLLVPELLAHALTCQPLAYTEGVLMLHSGHMLHQIAPVPEMQPGDRRITLQGHALPRCGVYQLYW